MLVTAPGSCRLTQSLRKQQLQNCELHEPNVKMIFLTQETFSHTWHGKWLENEIKHHSFFIKDCLEGGL